VTSHSVAITSPLCVFATPLDFCKKRVSRFLEFQQGLVFGNPTMMLEGSVRRLPLLDELNFGNACERLSSSSAQAMNTLPVPETDCGAVGKGVLVKGLLAGVQLFVQTATDLRARILQLGPTGTLNATRINEVYTSPEYNIMDILHRWWIPAGMMLESQMYHENQQATIDYLVQIRTQMLIAFLMILAATFVLVFEPLVWNMDIRLKRIRALLVMVPMEVILTTNSLRQALLSSV